MDGGNSKNVNEETPYADILKADPGASLNEQEDHHVPVDDNIFKMDAVRAELPLNLDKSKHVDQGKSTTKRVKNSRKVKDYTEKIRTSNGYLFYAPRSYVRTMLRRQQIEALKQQKESSEPAALVVTAALPSPSALADA
ncbi:hypothetical protein MKW92_006954 [Papaver armeniacum]|nr:hypothetical protein MKW92_006954 [Papaver armeniacum]